MKKKKRKEVRIVILIGNIDSQTLHAKTRNLVIGDFKVQSIGYSIVYSFNESMKKSMNESMNE